MLLSISNIYIIIYFIIFILFLVAFTSQPYFTATNGDIKLNVYYTNIVFEGYGEYETEVRAIMIELVDGKVPFSKMTVSSALKRAIHEAVTNMNL